MILRGLLFIGTVISIRTADLSTDDEETAVDETADEGTAVDETAVDQTASDDLRSIGEDDDQGDGEKNSGEKIGTAPIFLIAFAFFTFGVGLVYRCWSGTGCRLPGPCHLISLLKQSQQRLNLKPKAALSQPLNIHQLLNLLPPNLLPPNLLQRNLPPRGDYLLNLRITLTF